MRTQAWTGLLLAGVAPALAQSPPSLLDALLASGASKFAAFIQSDPTVLSLYTSGQIQTVFAPADSVAPATLKERTLSPKQQQQADYQSSKKETSIQQGNLGTPIESANEAPLLGGKGQVVVASSANGTGPTRRWDTHSVVRRQSNHTTPSLLKISSGLGTTTNVIKGDIPFSGGLLHITDR